MHHAQSEVLPAHIEKDTRSENCPHSGARIRAFGSATCLLLKVCKGLDVGVPVARCTGYSLPCKVQDPEPLILNPDAPCLNYRIQRVELPMGSGVQKVRPSIKLLLDGAHHAIDHQTTHHRLVELLQGVDLVGFPRGAGAKGPQ